MHCPYCEASISDTARKCRYCGEWVKGGSLPTGLQGTVRNEGDLSSAPAQNVTVNVADDSPMFAVVTLLFYIFIFPIGLLLNLVGLFTGPRRGCFLTMLILFVVVPAIVIFGILGLTVPEVIEAIAKFIKDFGNS